MQILATRSIPKLYSAYATTLSTGYSEVRYKDSDAGPRYVQERQFFCMSCETAFSARLNYRGMLGGYNGFDENQIICPVCGKKHGWDKDKAICSLVHKEIAPYSINLKLVETKDSVILEAGMETFQFDEMASSKKIWPRLQYRREKIKFDVKNRKTECAFYRYKGTHISERLEVGAPFNYDFLNKSLLYHLQGTLLTKDKRKELSTFMKILRETVQKKWKKIHGYKLKSTYVSYGTFYGMLLFPIQNIAYRLIFADANNLPAGFNAYHKFSMVNEKWLTRKSIDLDVIRNAKDSVSGMIQAYGLKDCHFTRTLLNADIFSADELSLVWKITDNVDYARQIWHIMQSQKWNRREHVKDIYDWLIICKDHYSVHSLVQYIDHANRWQLQDTKVMYDRLEDSRRSAVWNEKLKDIHDYLVQALKHQRAEGFKLDVPEHIRRRLSMQLDSLKFFIPEHSKELAKIGDELHNCVRTYDERMKAQQCNIVPVADDAGKLVACLEVRQNIDGDYELVQAKLKHNRPVYYDEKLNAEVLKWTRRVGIRTRTSDIRLIDEAATAVAI